jgi:hypothetical protein
MFYVYHWFVYFLCACVVVPSIHFHPFPIYIFMVKNINADIESNNKIFMYEKYSNLDFDRPVLLAVIRNTVTSPA